MAGRKAQITIGYIGKTSNGKRWETKAGNLNLKSEQIEITAECGDSVSFTRRQYFEARDLTLLALDLHKNMKRGTGLFCGKKPEFIDQDIETKEDFETPFENTALLTFITSLIFKNSSIELEFGTLENDEWKSMRVDLDGLNILEEVPIEDLEYIIELCDITWEAYDQLINNQLMDK